jgi:hypothetical protein
MRLFLVILLFTALGLLSCNDRPTAPRQERTYLKAVIDSGSSISISDKDTVVVSVRLKNNQSFQGLNAVAMTPIFLKDNQDYDKANYFSPYDFGTLQGTAFTAPSNGLYTFKANSIVHRPSVPGDLITFLSKVESGSIHDIDTLGTSDAISKVVALKQGGMYAVRLIFVPQ